jgi:GWxTD domain-containing protein
MRRFFLFLLGGLLALPAAAQSPDALITKGKKAFQQQNYERAERLLTRAAERDSNNADAHYLLSKLYYDTPLRDVDEAGDRIHKALDLEPNNVRFKTARLQILRRDAGNFIIERVRDAKRRRLAHEILQLDSTNAFAHEELGISYIHDFWRYRNAVSIPNLSFRKTGQKRQEETGAIRREEDNNPLYRPVNAQASTDPAPPGGRSGTEPTFSVGEPPPGTEASQVFVADRFDLKALKERGVPLKDLSARADYAYDRAIGHLRKALEIDPRRRPIYDRFMQIYALKEEPRKALKMLEEMYVNFPKDPELWLYLGYAHHQLDHREAASKSFREAFKRMKPKTRTAFSNISYIIPDDEKKSYESDSVRYASRFWTSKDPRYLTTYNERKLEHYARLVHADLLYAAPDVEKRGWETRRGRIYVRYGEPNVNAVLFTSILNNTDPSLGIQSSDDFAEAVSRQNAFNIWDYGDFRFVFEDPMRNGEYRLYSPPADVIASGSALPWTNDYKIKARETFREHPDRYEYEGSGRRVQLPYVVNTFKGEKKTDMYVHYGIPLADRTRPDSTLEVTARVGTFLVGESRNLLVERRRTIYGFKPEQMHAFEEATLWMNTQTMDAPPGEHQLSMELETSSTGAFAVQRRDVNVPRYGDEELAMSDLMLAYNIEVAPDGKPLSSSDVVRRGLSIQPAPWNVFSAEQPIYIFFENYNLAKEDGKTAYEVEAALAPKETDKGVTKFIKDLFGGGGEEGVSVRFEGTGQRSDDGQYFIMDASDEEPGVYTLVVRLTDTVTGETVEAQRDLYLE